MAPPNILVRISEVRIGYNLANSYVILNVKTVSWSDSDPWVEIPIPAGSIKYQHLKPNKVTGKMVCFNITSLYTALYATDVQAAAENQFAINPTTAKHNVVEYFRVKGKDIAGTEHTYTFTNVRIRKVSIGELKEDPTETPWIVDFTADLATKVV